MTDFTTAEAGIRALHQRYTDAVWRQDFDAFARCFAEDGEWRISGMVLKVASAYDELTEGRDEHAAWAVEALYTGPGYVYDGRVLGALERVLEWRGALIPIR